MSVAEPAVNATMILTGLVGYCCANAVPALSARMTAAIRIERMFPSYCWNP